MSEVIDVVDSLIKSGGMFCRGGSTCPKCGSKRVHNDGVVKRGWFCKTCNNNGRREWYKKEERFKDVMLHSAKVRARKKNLPFNLELEDIVIPDVCPVLGMPLKTGTRKDHWNAPTIDRIFLDEGYVKGNIVIISWRANFIRGNATLEELEKVLAYSKEITSRKFVVTPRPAAGGTFLPFRRILSETAVA
jgi:hypothetical protein